MRFDKKSTHAIFATVAAALTLFFAAYVPTSFAEPSATKNYAQAPSATGQGSDAGCQTVIAALEKNFTTPYHMYMTQTSAAVQNGKSRSSETVFIGGVTYVMVTAKWIAMPVSAEDKKTTEEEIRKNTKHGTCHYVRDESVNGESTALFAAHNQTDYGTSDNQVWISKSKGLIVKQESDIDVGGGRPKSHMSARFEYTNVQAPKM